MDNNTKMKIRRQMYLFAVLSVLGWAGGFSIMIVGAQLITTIIGIIMFAWGISAAAYAVWLGFKL